MFVALNEKNLYIMADQADNVKNKSQKGNYYCPACHEVVFLKKGAHIQPHFAHYAHHNCTVFSEGESQEHLNGKKILFDGFKKANIPCQIEAYLPELQQRPDLLIWPEPNRPIAIEFQCSSLSVEKMIERTEGYLQNGYDVFWIAGEKFRLKKRLTTFQHLFLKQHAIFGLYYLYLNSEKRQLEIFSEIQRPQPAGHCHFCLHTIDLDKTALSGHLFTDSFQFEDTKHLQHFSYLKSHDYLIRGRLYQNRKMVAFQKYIYTHGDSLISLPKEAYAPIQNEMLIHVIPHFWKYILLCWIKEKGVGAVFSKYDVDAKINKMHKLGELIFFAAPFIDEKTKNGIFYHFLAHLAEQKLISAISPSEWIILRLPQSYLYEREKLEEFEQLDAKEKQQMYLI